MIRALDHPPADNDGLRRSIYDGAVLRLAPTAASRRLVAEALGAIEAELGGDVPVREAQFRVTDGELFERIGRLRRAVYSGARFRRLAHEVVVSCGFDPDGSAFDPVKLRAVAHRGYENPLAAPVYYAHRDTWYAHPQSLINWWVPLHDLTERETFVFFPDAFGRAVPNDSERFDYGAWSRGGDGLKIGWQSRDAGARAVYPRLTGEPGPGPRVGFSSGAGEVLVFSGAHLHQTLPNDSGRTRFSLDFRTVHLGDHARGLGARNADNRSTGSALGDYIRPG
jgi:hypothetical protein